MKDSIKSSCVSGEKEMRHSVQQGKFRTYSFCLYIDSENDPKALSINQERKRLDVFLHFLGVSQRVSTYVIRVEGLSCLL